MSRRLTHEVGASRHPLLMTDPIARDVLWWMADAAQERNDCRIILAIADLAEEMGRGVSAVRFAQERLEKAGLIAEVGRGDYNKRVKVLCINEDALNQRNRVITQEATPRNDSGNAADNLLQPRSNLVPTSFQPRSDPALTSFQPRSDLVPLARARFEREQEPELEQDQTQIATGPIEPNPPPDPAPWSLPSHPEADRILAQHNAAASARLAGLAAGRPAPVPKAPTLPLVGIEPAPLTEEEVERTALEKRIAEAVAELVPLFADFYREASGLTHTARIEANWRKWLPTRLVDLGTNGPAVAARLDGIRRVIAWWRLPEREKVAPGAPSCWCMPSKRTIPFLLNNTTDPAGHCDKVIGWASEPARNPVQSRPAPKPWAAVGSAQLSPPVPDPVADAEHAERMAALDRIEQEHLAELERQAIADARAKEAAKPKAPTPAMPVKVPTEAGRGGFARMSEALALGGR